MRIKIAMLRSPIELCTAECRTILPFGHHKCEDSVKEWTNRVVRKSNNMPEGAVFEWKRDKESAKGTALLYDAVMCNVWYAQNLLRQSQYVNAQDSCKLAAKSAGIYKYVLTELLPKWTHVTQSTQQIPDAVARDIYGHYCLSRAMQYDKLLEAAPGGTSTNLNIKMLANSALMYATAAQLIKDDDNHYMKLACERKGDALCELGNTYHGAHYSEGSTNTTAIGHCAALFDEASKCYEFAGKDTLCEQAVSSCLAARESNARSYHCKEELPNLSGVFTLHCTESPIWIK